MSHPNPAGNGCSLEDCYTNLFALTDICGIKWRRLATNPDCHVLGLDHLEDPVLVSYSKCIQSDILCVWRRVQKNVGEQHTDHLSFNKELWIFWYGDEPAVLESHVSKDLTEKEEGSWDKGKDHGLSYECRTLLFKALHNLIERCLVTKGFVRLGKWFVQPYDSQAQNADKQTHLSFSFNFFLHGESSVCASIEVKQHPPVWRLTPQHLTLTQENNTNFQVILAPYGLNGTLTGQSYRETDQNAHKILEDWNKFYPIDMSDKEGDPSKTPTLVEVLVAGVRMKYPSSFVLLCDIEEYLTKSNAHPPAQTNMPRPQTIVPNSHLTPPSSPADVSIVTDHASKGGGARASVGTHHLDISSELIAKSERVFSSKIQEKVLQDNCVNSGIAKRSAEMISEDTIAGIWDFNDPTAKLHCNCSRHRLSKNKPILTGQNKAQTGNTPKHGKGDAKTEKVDRPPSRLGRNNTTPFHRQSTVNDSHVDLDLLMQRVPTQGANFNSAAGTSSLPQLNNAGENTTGMENHSPAAVPSPLEEPHSQSHASQSGEPTMPKLSPHPPPEVPEKEGLTKATTENSSAMMNGHVDFAKPNDVTLPKAADTLFSPLQSEAKTASIDNWIKSQQHKHTDTPGIKRPLLPTLQTDGDSFVTENLYNLDPLNLWLNLPVVKKPRYEALSSDGDETMLLSQNLRHSPQNSLEDDPYEFSDEASRNPATITNRKLRDSQNDGFHNRKSPYGRMEEESGRLDSAREDKPNEPGSLSSPPATPNTALKDSLMQVNDLVPKTSDLDHIFESDSDNDDAFMAQEKNIIDDLKQTKVLMNMPITEGVIAPSELIRMYPTPPSNNPEISPGTYGHEVIDTVERTIIKKEINAPSLEEFFKDVPSVFQPLEQEEFVSSDKYSSVSLHSLSPIHHPPDYKASWQFPMPIMDKPPPNSYINIPSIENIPSLPSRMPSSAVESSPAMFQTSSVGPQRTPMSYELQSPASNASSYLNKTLNSVDNQGTNNQIAEVHSLIVNILMMDSRLNVFKDANFDSCNFCVCNGNIKGADTGILIEDPSGEAQYSCTCGFSAIRNRRFGINAGIFYEDEVDITGVRNDRFDRRKTGFLSLELNSEHKGDDPSLLVLLLGQFTVPYSSPSSSQLLVKLTMNTDTSYAANSVDDFPLKDGNDVSYTALDQGRQAMEHCLPTKLDDPVMKSTCLHKWQFLQGASKIPLNSQDSQHLLKSLQPILQDAIQNKRVTRLWEQTFKLTGPLTWKEFHQLAGRGSEENSSPQPIPALLVGNDSDWLSVSPYSLRFWEKQFMEPYGKPRDIAYVVLAPDNNYVIDYVKIFFKELSNIYELCRFGRHAPFAKKLRDGIMRIGKKQAATKSPEEPGEEWFKHLGESPVTSKLKLYAQVCSSWLAPLLGQQSLDQSVFEPNTNYRAGYKPTEASQTNSTEHVFTVPQTNTSEDKENQNSESSNFKDASLHENDREKPIDCPGLVVYIIDPFTYGQSSENELDRLIKMGLLRCYLQLVKSLPDQLQQNIHLQIIPLHTVLECTEGGSNTQLLKAISFSVFTTCRWISSHTVIGRSLTGFGPGAAAEMFLKKKEEKEKMKLYSPPFVIAPTKDKQALLAECHGEKLEKSNVLYCSYCLSEDQRWLIAACTDEHGELMETVTINIEIPNRNRRKKASARKIGLKKLWDFILGVVTMTLIPSRLVIGRFGRMGHGELKGWSGLLSKKNILKSSRHIKDLCNVCSIANNAEIPGILSVCLISLESHSSFQVLADAVKAEEKMSSNCPLQTPQDASCTHILVFPISANAQANSTQMPGDSGVPLGLGNFEDVMDDGNILSDLHEDLNMDNDLNDGFLFNVFEEITNSPNTVLPGVGNTSNPGSPTDNGRHSLSAMNGSTSNSHDLDPQDEQPNLLQQPLAMGYYVSTADSGPLPKWFWSACPENENHKPYTFKAALHIHYSSNQDDFMSSSQRNSHPLDSGITCDVLRYVLENYNALSWLTFDPVKNDRQSSLPIHIVVLMQMYHALNAFL